MKDKQKRDFRKQKASRGGRLVAGTGSKISPETHLPFVVVNARPPHRSADRPRQTRSHVRSRARKAQSAGPVPSHRHGPAVATVTVTVTMAPLAGPPGRARRWPSLRPGRDAVMVTTDSESVGSQAVRRDLGESAAQPRRRRAPVARQLQNIQILVAHSLALSLKLDAVCRKFSTLIRQYNLVISKTNRFMIVFIGSKPWLCRLLELLLRHLELLRL